MFAWPGALLLFLGFFLQQFYIGLILEDYDEVHYSKKAATKITLKDTKEYVKRPMILSFLLLTAGMNGAFLSSILAEITNIAYESGIQPHLAATILVGFITLFEHLLFVTVTTGLLNFCNFMNREENGVIYRAKIICNVENKP